MTTQSIIVYRNPVEAAFWESGIIVPLGGALGTGFIVFLLLMWVAQKVSRRWQGPPDWMTISAAILSIAAGISAFTLLMV